jgi:hypothetical protein
MPTGEMRVSFKSLHSEKKASAKALALIRLMIDTYKKGLTMTMPDVLCFSYVLEAAAQSKEDMDVGAHVDEVLAMMKDAYLVPDTRCYTFAIRTWKNCAVNQTTASTKTREMCAKRAIDLLTEMETARGQSSSVDVVFSTANVNDALEALTVSNSLRRTEIAEGLLERLEAAASSDEKTALAPTAESYAHTLRVWRSVPSAEKVVRARRIVERFRDNFAKVARQQKTKDQLAAVFNEFIAVCGTYSPRTEKDGSQVLKEAIDVIELMLTFDGLQPNSDTYCELLEACSSLLALGQARETAVEKVFGFCSRDGMVNERVLATMLVVTTAEQYATLVVEQSEDVDGLRLVPESFTRNVLGGKTISVDGRRTLPLGVDGQLVLTPGMLEFRMRRLRSKKNQNLLRGGRLQATKKKAKPWNLSSQ